MATFSKADLGNLPHFKIELFATIGNGRAYSQWVVVLACCCGNSTIFIDKIKIGWKWPCLEVGIRYNFLFCRHVFTIFWKCQLLSVLLTFGFISKIYYKLSISSSGVLLTEAHILKNVVDKMQEKELWRSYFLKTKTNKFILMQLKILIQANSKNILIAF